MIFHHFLDEILKEGMLKVVQEEVSLEDIPKGIRQEEQGQNLAILFKSHGYEKGMLVGNLFGDPNRILRTINCQNWPDFFQRIDRAIQEPSSLKYAFLPTEDYRVFPGENLLEVVPSILYSPLDAYPYLTSGVVLSKDPDSGRRHLCFIRMGMKGGSKATFNPATPGIRAIVEKTVLRGNPLPIRVFIGPPLELILVSCLSILPPLDELSIVQSMGGGNLCFTDEELPAPIGCEYILDGMVTPEMEPEGPFGESTGVYSARTNPVLFFSKIYRRKKTIYHTLAGGNSREHLELLCLKARHYLERLRSRRPEIKDYELPLSGCGRLAVIGVAKKLDKEALVRDLIPCPLVRVFLLVDGDVKTDSTQDLIWAVVNRTFNRNDFRFEQIGESPQKEKMVIDALSKRTETWESVRIETGTS